MKLYLPGLLTSNLVCAILLELAALRGRTAGRHGPQPFPSPPPPGLPDLDHTHYVGGTCAVLQGKWAAKADTGEGASAGERVAAVSARLHFATHAAKHTIVAQLTSSACRRRPSTRSCR